MKILDVTPTVAPTAPVAPVVPVVPVLYIATPAYGGMISIQYASSVLQTQSALTQNGIRAYFDILGNESLVQRGRNMLVARMLKTDATHLLFIDADIGFTADTVMRLLKSGKEIACAAYAKKYTDFELIKKKVLRGDTEPVNQMGLDWNVNIYSKAIVENGFLRCMDSATGFMMIQRDVFTRMAAKMPEIECVNDILKQDGTPKYFAFFDCIIDPENKRYLSEDYTFCRRAQNIGIDVWVDIVSPLSHVGHVVYAGKRFV